MRWELLARCESQIAGEILWFGQIIWQKQNLMIISWMAKLWRVETLGSLVFMMGGGGKNAKDAKNPSSCQWIWGEVDPPNMTELVGSCNAWGQFHAFPLSLCFGQDSTYIGLHVFLGFGDFLVIFFYGFPWDSSPSKATDFTHLEDPGMPWICFRWFFTEEPMGWKSHFSSPPFGSEFFLGHFFQPSWRVANPRNYL